MPCQRTRRRTESKSSARDDAAKAQINIHELRGNVSIPEGSSNNVAVLTGTDGKVFIDAAIAATNPRILEAANSVSADPALLPACQSASN